MKSIPSRYTTEAIQWLHDLIAIPSQSRQEKDAANYLYTLLTELSLSPHRHHNNVWSISPQYNPSYPTLLLNAHIDTVKPASTWSYDPYTPTLIGDKLYGLGSNDDGASLVCLLQTYRLLLQQQQSYNLVYLASAEEEVSGANGIASVLSLLPPIDVALVGEPTQMQPAIAEKGLMVLDCTSHGISGHAAREEGINALYTAIPDIIWFRDYQFPHISTLLGPIKMSVTMIQAGTQHNVVPDTCKFTVDIRTNECYKNEEVLAIIRQHVQSTVQARSTRLSSSHISPTHPLVQRVKALGKIPYGSPTLSDQALMPFPSLKMGPGDSSRSHTADEYIHVGEITDGINTYIELLDGINIV